MRWLFAPLCLLVINAAAQAQPARCATPPREPLCLDRLGSSNDPQAVAYCRSEVNDYRSRMSRYVDCLSDEIERSRRQRDRAEDRLDCFARGSGYCP
jgi:hypothetical protein